MASGTEELEIEQLQKVHDEATMLVALLSRYRENVLVILRFFSLMQADSSEHGTETYPYYCYLMRESHSCDKSLIEFLTKIKCFLLDSWIFEFLSFFLLILVQFI